MIDIAPEVISKSLPQSSTELGEEDFNLESDWNSLSLDALKAENYSLVIDIYEEIVQSSLSNFTDYLYLGLAYLLNGAEDLAQMSWFSTITESELSEEIAYKNLSNILEKEACHQAQRENLEMSWTIRQYLKEVEPSNVKNQLCLIILSIKLKEFSSDLLEEYQILEVLKSNAENSQLDESFFEEFVNEFLRYCFPQSIEVLTLLSQKIKDKKKCVNILLPIVHKTRPNNADFAGRISKICADILPANKLVLQTLYWCYSITTNYQASIDAVHLFEQQCKTVGWKLVSTYLLQREQTRSGNWSEIDKIILEYKHLMYEIVETGLLEDDFLLLRSMSVIPCMLQYYQDNPTENRYLQNSLAKIAQEKIAQHFSKEETKVMENSTETLLYPYNRDLSTKQKKLRIGFMVSRLKLHSVGWLSRWLFHYYDREKVDFFVYVINQLPGDSFTQIWFEQKVEKCTYFIEGKYCEAANAIYLDEIDILIDLDSTTSHDACFILSLKPAPIQATWLGFDATGIPTVDYFIVDPYLLPENAQDYYSEKLWRLPQTYLAVDGFESEVPTLFRRDLNISDDAVIYLTAQTGQKRNPHTIRLQLQILNAVPNSYLLIKGTGEGQVIQDLFSQLAQEEGVDINRLRFLTLDPNEFVHRANLQVADVILDTYPYNGATTTLEALWMGIPIVTRLGQQCAARNSYTFLAQVGVTEGIAITDSEYINWGIQFGKDPLLRQKVGTQLRESRKTSPLWNTRQFAREMESAFQQMWEIHTQSIENA